MSEKTALPVSIQTKRTKILSMSLPVLILLLVYGAGFIVLPLSIFSSFQSKNCDSVLTLNKTYTSLYPDFVEDESLSAPVDECIAFKLASLNEENELWRDAYDAYQVYSGTYPNGLYAAEVHEHSAIVLLNIAKDESEQKNYDEAVADLGLILASYSDTSVSSDAMGFLPSVYTSWGAGLRESGDFEESEQIFNDFKAWSNENQRTDLELDAKRELAETYVAWGLDLRSQKQFEAALSRFDLAISAAPDLVESVAEAKSGQRKTYIEWGNDLLAQGNHPLAIEKFELAVSRTGGNNEDGASDSLANGHIQWASDLSADEDFFGALDHLEIAQTAALKDDSKQSVEAALQETYFAFSSSTGRQAKQVIRDTLDRVCEKNGTPELPIFGLDKDSIRVGLYGVEAQLPEDLAARTPGEIHYIACVQVERRVLEVDGRYVYVKVPNGYIRIPLDRVSRIRVFWTITVQESDTGKALGTETFAGGPPPPFPKGGASGGGDLEGPPPSLDVVRKWLLSVIK